MTEFAFIFRQTPIQLTDEQQKQRAAQVAAWATRLRDQGHSMHPYLLGKQPTLITLHDSAGAPSGDPIVAILIAGFSNIEEARAAAASHPGLHYGITIEIREASAPQFQTPPPSQPAQ